eukprot:scaffold17119_cov123-Isochrysis_galbana.AAC.2
MELRELRGELETGEGPFQKPETSRLARGKPWWRRNFFEPAWFGLYLGLMHGSKQPKKSEACPCSGRGGRGVYSVTSTLTSSWLPLPGGTLHMRPNITLPPLPKKKMYSFRKIGL